MPKLLLIASGSLIFLTTAAGLFFVNFNFGAVMLFGLGCCLILYGSFFEKLVRLKWLNRIIFAGCALALIMMLSVGLYGKTDTAAYDEEAVVVLGAGIRGELVSLTLARRLDKAVEYYRKNPDALIVVSGAQGPQERITEALAMERYLRSRGIPEERIVKEEAATNTYENLSFSKAILDGLLSAPYRVVIVTNEFHMYRTMKLAKKLGLDAARVHSDTMWYEIPRNYLRECVAICKVWVLGK